MKRRDAFELYRDYLIANESLATSTGLSSLLDNNSKKQLEIRSPQNFLMNLFSGLAAYSFIDKKPSILPFKQERFLDNIISHQIVLI